MRGVSVFLSTLLATTALAAPSAEAAPIGERPAEPVGAPAAQAEARAPAAERVPELRVRAEVTVCSNRGTCSHSAAGACSSASATAANSACGTAAA